MVECYTKQCAESQKAERENRDLIPRRTERGRRPIYHVLHRSSTIQQELQSTMIPSAVVLEGTQVAGLPTQGL